MARWRLFSWRPLRRRLTAVGALTAYLAATIGLPVPPPPIIKDGGKAFPCQGRACGCLTAEECWRHCCCTTPEERWAWAAEHHVTPPAYAEKPAATPTRERTAADTCACCRGKSSSASPPPLLPVRWGLAASALRCRGLSTLWITTGVVPATPPAVLCRPAPVAGERLSDGDVASSRIFHAPPLPPPRLPLSV